jgi:cytochrome P450
VYIPLIDILLTSRMFAGADTVSVGIRAIMIALLENPSCYRKLQAQVDEYYNTHLPTGELTYQ